MSSAVSRISRPPRLKFSHFGISVVDIVKMERFYRDVLGFTVTDRGENMGFELVFLSRDPDEHHQLVLATGRPPALPANTANPLFGAVINQISFRLDDLSELRLLNDRLKADNVEGVLPGNHGTSWSLYFPDPEGNMLECFVDTPWYVEQPFMEPLDLSVDDATLWTLTQQMCSQATGYRPYADWRAEVAVRMAEDQAGRC
ncbi:VOC family protein [Mycobacterium sp. Y57]|uniref:VOC family protein n=1 Tax=Mycolicibacterium xanthum TaxID=2796469 RepID=UPI001C85FEF3|nr:VOC family protein [Mycolicibacterium xanthum]MBX7430508.1 VOC family protein [Mycolicibacterium xanthum]